jgi:hypothetical protein
MTGLLYSVIQSKLQKITIPVAQNSLVAALKKMPDLSIPSVIVLGIAKLKVLHDLGQWNVANLD